MIELSDYFANIGKVYYVGDDGSLEGFNKVEKTKISPNGVRTLFNLDFYKFKLYRKNILSIVRQLNQHDVVLDISLFQQKNKLEEKRFYEKITKIIGKLKKSIIALNLRVKSNFKNILYSHTLIPSFLFKTCFKVLFINLTIAIKRKQLFAILKSGAKQLKLTINDDCCELLNGLSISDLSSGLEEDTKIELTSSFGLYENNSNFHHFSKVKENLFNNLSKFKIKIYFLPNTIEKRAISKLLRIMHKIQSEIIYFQFKGSRYSRNRTKCFIKDELDIFKAITELKQKY